MTSCGRIYDARWCKYFTNSWCVPWGGDICGTTTTSTPRLVSRSIISRSIMQRWFWKCLYVAPWACLLTRVLLVEHSYFSTCQVRVPRKSTHLESFHFLLGLTVAPAICSTSGLTTLVNSVSIDVGQERLSYPWRFHFLLMEFFLVTRWNQHKKYSDLCSKRQKLQIAKFLQQCDLTYCTSCDNYCCICAARTPPVNTITLCHTVCGSEILFKSEPDVVDFKWDSYARAKDVQRPFVVPFL